MVGSHCLHLQPSILNLLVSNILNTLPFHFAAIQTYDFEQLYYYYFRKSQPFSESKIVAWKTYLVSVGIKESLSPFDSYH